MAPDGKLYNSGRKGELFELKQGLNSSVAKERKTALKRTVAAMTLGKDVSSLFTDVIKNTASDLAMKKLVYLYIINYAKSNPELSLLVINTFIKDAADPHPLIRALAIRTMALIPLENVTEYLCEPLHSCLNDSDPYVQKTAAIAVAKLFDTNPSVVRDENFVEELRKLVLSNNPLTVANAVAALTEIASASDGPSVLDLNAETVPRFLTSLSECTEWGQVFILDSMSSYTPSFGQETDFMIERVIPRLQHSNAAVVLSAVRLMVRLMPRLDSDAKRGFVAKKISPPLMSMLSAPPELQFVALRNMSLLAECYSEILNGDVKMFFVSYSDPLYVKVEKLDILVRLANGGNADIVLGELKEYTSEVDVAFVRKAVSSIGRVIVKQPLVREKGVAQLVELLKMQIPHVVEEVAVALADVLRAYPGQFNYTVPALCEASSVIDDPVARSALVWIIGEHAGSIPGISNVLSEILETLAEEGPEVQLQILSACFKAFLVCGAEADDCFRRCVEYATVECVHIDVRERGFLYLRLSEANREEVKSVILNQKPGITGDSRNIDPALMQELLASMGSLASVYHKPTSGFEGVRERVRVAAPLGATQEEDLLGLDGNAHQESTIESGMGVASVPTPSNGQRSLLNPLDELLGSMGVDLNEPDLPLAEFTTSDGLHVLGALLKDDKAQWPHWMLKLNNESEGPMTGFQLLMEKNAFGLELAKGVAMPSTINVKSQGSIQAAMVVGGEADLKKGTDFEFTLKFLVNGLPRITKWTTNIGERLDTLLDPRGALLKAQFLSTWQSLPDSVEVVVEVSISSSLSRNADATREKLKQNNVFTVARRTADGRKIAFCSAKIMGGFECEILCELSMPLPKGPAVVKLASRSTLGTGGKPFIDSFHSTVARLLRE